VKLRTRLAVLVAGAVAVAVVLAVVVTYRVAANQQHEALDQALETQADATAGRAALIVDLTARFPRRADPFAAEDLLFQVIGAGGLIRQPLDQAELPVSDDDLAVAQGESTEAWSDVEVDGESYRMITVPLPDRRPLRSGAVQLARPLGPVEDSLADLRRTLVAVAALGVGVAALLGIAVARRALRPVEALTETAEHVAATQELRSRIVVDRPDELGRLAESFNAMLAALATSQEQQQRLVTDASHELRTPLTSLRTNVELLQRADALPAEERRQIVDDAVREVGELSALVNELVELATDARRANEEWQPVALDEVVARAAERARRHHGVEVDLHTEPTVVHGSTGLLERAVTNLLDNAGKWSPPGGRVLVVLAPDPFAGATGSGASTRLSVLDDGPGVGEADLARLWDRFWRAEGSQQVPGSGLGLAIVREVVEAHGGTVHAANRSEGGLEVGFTLPQPTPGGPVPSPG
jgi:two-component system sensor histidine kinase MprB